MVSLLVALGKRGKIHGINSKSKVEQNQKQQQIKSQPQTVKKSFQDEQLQKQNSDEIYQQYQQIISQSSRNKKQKVVNQDNASSSQYKQQLDEAKTKISIEGEDLLKGVKVVLQKNQKPICYEKSFDQYNISRKVKQRFYELKALQMGVKLNDTTINQNKEFQQQIEKYAHFLGVLQSQKDVLCPIKQYPTRQEDLSMDPLQETYLIHCLNHVYQSAEIIRGNNQNIQQQQQQYQDAQGQNDRELDISSLSKEQIEVLEKKNQEKLLNNQPRIYKRAEELPKDQGYFRAKVLILQPTRKFALYTIQKLLQLAIKETRKDSIQGKEKFIREFSEDPIDLEFKKEFDEKYHKKGKLPPNKLKPLDFQHMFDGNNDDHFIIGLKITRGQVRLNTDVYDSDIIVASPLGLITKVNKGKDLDQDQPQQKLQRHHLQQQIIKQDNQRFHKPQSQSKQQNSHNTQKNKTGDSKGPPQHIGSDFLSSIEILVIDRADFMLMQNWQHVVNVLQLTNQIPLSNEGINFMRVKEYFLDGKGAEYRQNIILSSFNSLDFQSLIQGQCHCKEGVAQIIPRYMGVLGSLKSTNLIQIFEKVQVSDLEHASDQFLDHFKKFTWPKINSCQKMGQLVVVPSYYDFIRLKSFLVKEEIQFLQINEYQDGAEIQRNRTYFQQDKYKVLLYTERAHFYHRLQFKNLNGIWIYGLLQHANFYTEICQNLINNSIQNLIEKNIYSIFNSLDQIKLYNILGFEKAQIILQNQQNVFIFQ